MIILLFFCQSTICQTQVIYFKNDKDSAACLEFLKILHEWQSSGINPLFENHPELQNEVQSFQKLWELCDSTLISKQANSAIFITTIVDTLGGVKCIKFMSPLGNAVNNQIIAIVKDWKFRPATFKNKPVEMESQFQFKIKKRKKSNNFKG